MDVFLLFVPHQSNERIQSMPKVRVQEAIARFLNTLFTYLLTIILNEQKKRKVSFYMSNLKMFPREKSIVFIGFMGVGKTTIGKLVAQNLNRSFIDIDEEIEKEYKMPTTKIFQTIGETAFREKEKALITHFCNQNEKIISVGGGAFLQKEVRDVCLSNCTVIALDISWAQWKGRLEELIDSRPILKGLSMEEIEALFYKRKEIYTTHHLKFSTDHLNEEEIATTITESLRLAWDLHDQK